MCALLLCVLCADAQAIAEGQGKAAAFSEAVAQAGLGKVGGRALVTVPG